MKRKLFIHVGPHKTGTTVIQKVCVDNRTVLEKTGVVYPDVFFNHLGHHGLIDKVRRRSISEKEVSELFGHDKDILLSSENFIYLNAQDWDYLKSTFYFFDISIIYAWRRSSLKMYSMWQESIKHGESKCFESYYYNDLVRPGASRRLSQFKNIDIISKVFEKKNILIMDYDSLYEENNFLKEFFNIFSIDIDGFYMGGVNEGVKNTSMPSSHTEILRCFNAYSLMAGNVKSSKVREKFFKNRDVFKCEIESLELLMNDFTYEIEFGNYLVDKNTENQMIARYKESVFGYGARNRVKKIKFISQDWLLNSDSSEKLKSLYENMILDCS